jgi:hypothetical protein
LGKKVILGVVGEGGIMKGRPRKPSYDASQTHECEKYPNLAPVGEKGIVKPRKFKPSYDASQTSEGKKYATITFESSPFYGQKGRVLKQIAGPHPELQLEMRGGEKIRVDLSWTDHRNIESMRSCHFIDLAQATKIIEFLEYLQNK